MQVNASQNHLLFLGARGAYNTPAGTEDTERATPKATPAATGTAIHSAKAPVTGTSTSSLSSDTIGHLIKAAQEDGVGQTSEPASGQKKAIQAAPRDVAQEFLDYMLKTPAERYYEQFLAKRGLTKEALEALPPEERAKIEAEILEEIKMRVAASSAGEVEKSGS